MKAEFEHKNVMQQRGQLVKDVPNFRIKPKDIDATRHLFDAYGNIETEISAGWIIRMCQQKGSWEPFTKAEIEAFYHAKGKKDGFNFNELVQPGTGFFIMKGYVPVGGGWIVEKEGKYCVTTTFVEAAYKSSPVAPKK